MIICICHNISEAEIKSAIQAGSDDMHSLRENLGIGSDCGKCKSCAKKILRECAADEKEHKAEHKAKNQTPSPSFVISLRPAF